MKLGKMIKLKKVIGMDIRGLDVEEKEKFDSDRDMFLSAAIKADDGGWVKHTDYHWSRTVNNSRLDYWPSRKKYQYKGMIMRGDVMKFIKRQVSK